jgi:hypothetical protein
VTPGTDLRARSQITIDDSDLTVPAPSSTAPEANALIEEARRLHKIRQRRRWFVMVAIIVAVAGIAAAVAGVSGGPVSSPRRLAHPFPPPRGNPKRSFTSHSAPQRPGSLTIGPDGNVYISDDTRSQILRRNANGTFQVVAGNGTAGYSGDGGPAARAELNDPGGITFGPDGTLYIADLGNGRIRAVSTSGTITTIAGDGKQTGWVSDGTPALAAALSPMAMTFGLDGLMYVASQSEVLRLGSDGTFTRVLGDNRYTPYGEQAGVNSVSGPAVDASADGANGLAFDSAGNLYVSGFDDKSILMVNPHGTVSAIGPLYPHGDGGLVTAPNGTVLAIGELSVVRLSPQGIQTVVAFPGSIHTTYLGITGLSPNGIAVASNGSLYLDTGQNGFADKTALIVINPQGVPSLLWEQNPSPGSG